MSNHKKSKLEADLERHRMSNFQTMGRKFVKLEAGYEGELSFMEGSPSMFWLNIQSNGLYNLQEYLRISYGSKMGDGGGEDLDTGSLVLAKYSVDKLYYRARIQEVVCKEEDSLESMYSVIFVDYGNSGVVFGKELMAWDSHLDVLPEQAVSCCLEGAPALWKEEGGATWTPEQLEAFQRTMRQGELRVQLRRELRGRDRDPRRAKFEVLVWLAGERLLQILKRQSMFAADLEDWKQPVDLPVDQLDISKLKIQPTEPVLRKERRQARSHLDLPSSRNVIQVVNSATRNEETASPVLLPPTASVLLAKRQSGLRKMEPGCAAIASQQSLSMSSRKTAQAATQGSYLANDIRETPALMSRAAPETPAPISTASRKTPAPISMAVPELGTNAGEDEEAPGSPVHPILLKQAKGKVLNWLKNVEIPEACYKAVSGASSDRDSDIVNFAQ